MGRVAVVACCMQQFKPEWPVKIDSCIDKDHLSVTMHIHGMFDLQLGDKTRVGELTIRGKTRQVTFPAKVSVGEGEVKARTEFALAHKLRPRKVSDYPSLEHLRRDLILAIREYRLERDRGIVADFDRELFDASTDLYRIGGGSLGLLVGAGAAVGAESLQAHSSL